MNSKLRCIIVDDESLAQQGLQEHIEAIDFLELAGTADDVEEALKLLKSSQIDLMFLDIQMPGINGIDFLKTVKILPKTILTTAYPEYALESYELDVVDYLLKPISFDRFYKSCKKAKEIIYGNKITDPVNNESFFIKSNKKFEVIQINDILFIEALQNYIIIHTHHKKSVAYLSLKDIVKSLPPALFIQVHKSYIVSVKHIASVSKEEINISGHSIPVGRSYSDSLFKEIVSGKLIKK